MNKEELLRRLEERLARGEISEKTFLGIKERYDAMPDTPEPEGLHEPNIHEDHEPSEGRAEDIEGLIERTVESAMEQAAASLEVAFGSKKVVEERMRDVNRRIQQAMSKVGPRVESGGNRIVIRGAGVLPRDTTTKEFRSAGSSRVMGDLLANEVRVAGTCVVDGDCECIEFRATGKTKIHGDIQAEEFRSAGKTEIGGDLRGKEVAVAGKVKVNGGILEAQEVSLAGSIDVGGWVRTKDFVSKGQFDIKGGLEALDVEMRTSGTSRVPIINAEEVAVRRGDRKGQLLVGTIDAKEVYVESTRATLIRAPEVHVGPFCTIDAVEAKELEVHETSTVKERRPWAAKQ